MDKNAIKKYAIWARRELIERVAQRAAIYGITEKGYGDPDADSITGRLLSLTEKQQRKALIRRITEKGYQQVIEEVAYTWFNRFAALRFMEVNGYLPSHVRVFTNDANEFEPQILAEAIHLDLEGLNKNKVYELENENKTEELFKYLLIVQCNALNEILPGMFQKIDDYTELLLPDNLLRQGSVIEQLITMIPEEDWTDQVQIIGWLYQFYNIEPKAAVFAKAEKIRKEEIPAATQLFTPDWIVRYMVENSLGRLWLEGHPNDDLKASWKYYIDEAKQEPDVQRQLDSIHQEFAALRPENILIIDPCQGSGHILAYIFDVLVSIYEAYGYTTREAVASIVEKNIWGLDIDERATQLAYFSVMMKARQYDHRFFRRGIQPHVYTILESNNLNHHDIEYFVDGRKELKSAMDTLVKELYDAKEYGSILNITRVEFSAIYSRFEDIKNEAISNISSYHIIEELLPFVRVAEAMSQKYDVVITNPPYMGGGSMGNALSKYVKKNYPDSKSDLFAVFIERCKKFTKKFGFQAMITQHSWMYINSFEKLREKLNSISIVNMAHLGPRAFEEISGEVVQTTSFVFRNVTVHNYYGVYCRLVEQTSQASKERLFLSGDERYLSQQDNFLKIPGSPIVYVLSDTIFKTFNERTIATISDSRCGMNTGDNDFFIRLWYEVSFYKFGIGFRSVDDFLASGYRYAVYNKGGLFRKWYGNLEYVIKFDQHNYNILLAQGNHLPSRQYYFLPCITWTDMSTKGVAFRYQPEGSVFDGCAATAFVQDEAHLYYLLGLLNSSFVAKIAPLLNPTLHFKLNDYNKIPLILKQNQELENLVTDCIAIAKQDWDSFETSWDFSKHPMVYYSKGVWDVTATMCTIHHFFGDNITVNTPIEASWWLWKAECEERFQQLKANEEELNRIFIDIYGLQDELTPEVADKDITVRKADLGRDIRSFISYAVGCMFGRYSLDHEGLIFAGGDFNEMFSKRKEYLADGYYNPDEPPAKEYICLKTNDGRKTELSFPPDKDNILPICDDEYFADDIVGRFVKFIEIVYGKRLLEENLRFIADALGGKGAARDVIRNYFINDFYTDHLKVYQKRPIYWLFDSGKKNGFKCLIYMHRYQPDTIARIRTDYIHEQQSRYRTAIADLEQRINSASTAERVKLNRQLSKLQDQAAELKEYEEKIHHLADQMIKIDLDDGVKVNYAKFQDVLAKIK